MPTVFKNDAPQIETLGRGMHLMPQFGISVEQIQEGINRRVAATDALTEAIRNEKYTVYCYGITTHLPSLPSWDEYVTLRDQRNHRSFWVSIRRRLFPGWYKRLGEAYIEAQLRVQEEFLDKVLTQ